MCSTSCILWIKWLTCSSVYYLLSCIFYIKYLQLCLSAFIFYHYEVKVVWKGFTDLITYSHSTNFISLLPVVIFPLRQSPGCGSNSRFFQGWPEAGQVWGDHLRPRRREENPGHLEELLLWVTRCGVCGGLERCPADPGNAGDHGRGPPAPTHRWQTCASVSVLSPEEMMLWLRLKKW